VNGCLHECPFSALKSPLKTDKARDVQNEARGAELSLRKFRPHVRAALAAACTGEVRFDVGEPDVIGPTVSVGFDVMAAAVIASLRSQ
jgi:hypothetical protein